MRVEGLIILSPMLNRKKVSERVEIYEVKKLLRKLLGKNTLANLVTNFF